MKKISPRAARRYAQTLFESYPIGEIESVSGALSGLSVAIAKNAQLTELLNNPKIRLEEREQVVRDLGALARPGDGVFANFLALLLENQRFNGISEIDETLAALVRELKALLQIEVVTANEIDSAEREGILANLKTAVGSAGVGGSLTVSWKVDPKLIGGVIFKLGDKILDGSVEGRYQKLRAELMGSAS